MIVCWTIWNILAYASTYNVPISFLFFFFFFFLFSLRYVETAPSIGRNVQGEGSHLVQTTSSHQPLATNILVFLLAHLIGHNSGASSSGTRRLFLECQATLGFHLHTLLGVEKFLRVAAGPTYRC